MTRDPAKDTIQPSTVAAPTGEDGDTDNAYALFDLAPLPYQSLNETGRILNVNRAWLEMLGYEKSQVLGRRIGDYLTPNSIELLKERFCIFLAEGEVRHAEFHLICRDGRRVLVSVNGRIAYDSEGNFRQTHCILTDITDIRRAEDELTKSERQFRGLFESNLDGIAYTDIQGSIRTVNPAFCAMLGFSEDELLGKNVMDITPEEWHEPETLIFNEQVLVQGHCEEFQKEFFHKDGRQVPASVRLWLNRDEKGTIVGAWGIVRDISKTIQAEEALRQSEQQYRRIVETANEGIVGLDADRRILFTNQVMADFVGYPQAELVGMPILALYRPEDHPTQEQRFATRKKGVSEKYERQFVRKDTSIVWGLVSATPLLSDDDSYLGSFAMVSDITDRKQAEAELRESELKYRTIFNNSTEGLYQSSPEGRFINVNPAFARIMGYASPDDLVESVTDIATQFYSNQGERSAVMEIMERDGEITEYELRHTRKDGSVIWVSENARVVKDEAGNTVLYEGSIVDITERKKAKDALKLTQFSVDNAPLAIYWINPAGEFIYVNDNACANLGYTRDEMLGMTVADINPTFLPEDWPSHWEQRTQSEIKRFESIHQRKDGSEFPVDIISHYKTYDGMEFLFTFSYDLTDSQKAEKALRQSQELLNEVQRMSLTGGWEVDMQTGRMTWTEGQYRLHGVSLGDAPSSPQELFERFIHPEDRSKMAAALSTVIKEQVPAELEYRVIRPDGEEVIFQTKGIPDVDATGQVSRVFGSTRDVTMERQAAQELAQSHERLLTILDGIDADIYVSDFTENTILFMNAHMRDHFGTPDTVAKCHSVFRDEPEPCSFCSKPYLLEEDGSPVETLVSERYNPLTKRWYLNHDRAIQWLEGELVHMHMAADITALKNMEEELKLAMAEAESANMSKNEFLANMSHEIRTPLNGLLGMLQLLQLTSLVDEQRDYLDTATESGRNLLQILNDILDLSKIESGKLEFDEQAMELGEVLDSVIAVFRHQAQSRGITMEWRIDESLPRHFLADKGRLRQILFNLVGNSSKFTENGSVTVEAYPLSHIREDGRVQLYFSVSDTGIGIPEEKIDQIFDPFTQVDGSFTRKYQGTGLGLGIVRRLVTLMDGNIAVASDEGKGTTIVFTLLVHPSPVDETQQHASSKEAGERHLTILVAEDERVNRTVVERLLSKLGHKAVCVEDGERAIRLLQKHTFDCVLTDIQMPGMDGLETTRVIREELGLDIPIIALTAHAMKGDRKRFLEAGMDGYMSKPFEMGELQEELHRVMVEAEK
ncbi:PAS domain S-box protein [Pseudodesulfovibrio sp.]|nr:PAS domain S-box protein [Pseudodesulfovibrio sp.]